MYRTPPYSPEEIKKQIEIYEQFIDFFNEENFPVITEWDGNDFLNHINSIINKVIEYLESKRNIDPYMDSSIINQTQKFYRKFPEVIELGLMGKRSLAYKSLTNEIMPSVLMSFTTFKEMTHHWLKKAESDFVFRMRVDDNAFNSKFTSRDLFHIPFEKRHLIGNNRFSLTGFPCLYFGNSVYCCWEEMGRPDLDHCFSSRFDLKGHHFIDLTRKPNEINFSLKMILDGLRKIDGFAAEETVRSFEYLMSDYLRIWPLIFCCSVRTYYPHSVFKPEYIFPQLLLEWLISDAFNMFDGIKFNSTKVSILSGKLNVPIETKMKNYVIPARILKTQGLCDESISKINATKPINLQIERLTNNIHPITNSDNTYENTVFGQLEFRLNELETKPILIFN